MCQLLISTIEHQCGHRIDKPGDMWELKGCKKCGAVKKTSCQGKIINRDPCRDCVANNLWVKKNGKWQEA
jgi:predicted  nucleic acid-binding Zn-ribbon protein